MITEGIGQHAPSPVRELLTESDLRVVASASLQIAKYRGWSREAVGWKRGLIAEPLVIPRIGIIPAEAKPMFVGLIAEAAVVIYFNRRCGLQLSLKDQLLLSGDGGADIEIGCLTMQVKSRQSSSSHSKQSISLVRYATGDGRHVFPSCTAIVFCETMLPAPVVKILGWIYTAHAIDREIVPARIGNHWNIEIADSLLEPMGSLAERITAGKELSV